MRKPGAENQPRVGISVFAPPCGGIPLNLRLSYSNFKFSTSKLTKQEGKSFKLKKRFNDVGNDDEEDDNVQGEGACLYRGPVTRPSQGTALTSSLRHISSLPRHISTTYLFEEGAKIHC